MFEHGEVIAEGVINVAFIAGTGGVGLVVSGTKTLAQYGTKVAIGFTFDVVIQAAVAKYFGEKEDISWEEAFTGINYLQATRSGAEALYDNAYASGALSCLGDLTIKGTSGELKVEDMPLECVTSFASSYLAEKAFKAGGGIYLMLKSKAVASPKHFAKGLKAIGLKDEQVEAFCKYLQLEEYTQKVLLQWKILKNEFLSSLQNKPPFKGNSSKLFDDFVVDFADDPLKLANFEKTPSLVDSWKKMKDLGADDALRRNPKALEALNQPKFDRPDPRTYLDANHITNHLKHFDGGVTKITSYNPANGTVGPPGGTFVLPKSQADDLIKKSGGDVKQLEDLLGLERGDLGSNPYRIDVDKPSGLRMPNGNERGANEKWIPGGRTSGGILEATVDQIQPGTYISNSVF